MFRKEEKSCTRCEEKDKQIKYLKDQVKDLQDRFLALSPAALAAYNEKDKEREELSLEPLQYQDDDGNWRTLSVEETKEWMRETEQIYNNLLEEPMEI